MKQNVHSYLPSASRLRTMTYAVAASIVLLCPFTSKTSAQSPPITSSGLNTTITHSDSTYNITGGTRPGGGANLFHSFGDFNVPNNNIANFLNDSGLATSNILGRVTGGDVSNIFGTIQTTGFGNANLFLMNPAGFLFGPNATVNVGGMVAFTSADYLKLADGVRFNATPNLAADTLLSASPVAAFGFLGSNPGAITVRGSQFTVTEGTGISLVGGNISIESGTLEDGAVQPAHLSAPNGKIQLASAASPGEFDAATLQALPNVDGASFSSFGSVTLAPDSTIDLRHEGSGVVSIRGGEFVLTMDNSILTTSVAPSLAPVENSISLAGGSLILSRTTSGAEGAAIEVITDTLDVTSGSQIVSSNESSAGLGGNINITATKSVTISGYDEAGTSGVVTDLGFSWGYNKTSGIFAGTIGDGPGGALNVKTPKLTIENSGEVTTLSAGQGSGQNLTLDVGTLDIATGGRVATVSGWNYVLGDFGDGTGQAGVINILATDAVSVIGSGFLGNPSSIQSIPYSFAGGGSAPIEINAPSATVIIENGGRIETLPGFGAEPTSDITLTVKNLTITDGSLNTIGGEGRSGNIWVNATGTVSLSGEVIGQPFAINNETGGSGGTGIISIETGILALSHRARILNSTFFDTTPSLDTKISIHATELVTMTDGSDIRVANFLSDVGGLEVRSPSIVLSGQASMNTVGFSTGNSGPITINTQNFSLTGGSTLNSSILSGSAGQGGSITIQGLASPAESVLIDGHGSGVFTDTKGTGAGGNIFVNANTVALQNGASVSASSTGTGNAGNILINAGQNYTSTDSAVTTQAAQASGGNITVLATDTVQLTNSQLNASVQGSSTTVGGNITIDPQYVILQNSQILAQATQGQGGAISITITNGGLFLPDATSTVSASSQFGVNGTVTIQSPNAPGSGKIQPLGKTPLLATSLLNQRCAALAGGEFSSFTVAGRDSLPTEPASWLASPLYAAGVGEGQGVRGEGREGETPILSLRQIAPAGFLTQTFALDWSAGCTS